MATAFITWAGRELPVASIIETVPIERYRAVAAERDQAERLLAEAEAELARLRGQLAVALTSDRLL